MNRYLIVDTIECRVFGKSFLLEFRFQKEIPWEVRLIFTDTMGELEWVIERETLTQGTFEFAEESRFEVSPKGDWVQIRRRHNGDSWVVAEVPYMDLVRFLDRTQMVAPKSREFVDWDAEIAHLLEGA